MSITLSALQKQRRDSAANWTAENPTLLAGEIGIESDTGYWKVGDGSTAWTSLAYISGLGAEIPVSRLADGSARQLLQTAANGTDVEWTSNVDIPGTLDVTGIATFDAAVTIQGNLTVNGTTTTIDTQNLIVEDKNVIIGQVTTPTDVTADGGGITLKGTTDKTINWVDATDAWTLSEHVNIASGKEYRINGTKVLDATSLGSSVLITSANITDNTIVDGDVNASAAIAGTKISPDFGSQNITTSGNITATNQGDIRLGEATANGSNYIAFQAPASLAADVTYTLPSADGTSGQVLSTNGSGTLSWAAISSSSITQGNTSAEVIDTGTDGRFVVTTEGTERTRVTSDGVQCYNQPAEATYTAGATLTVSDLKTGIVSYTGGVATFTLPTGTDTEAGFSNIYTNMAFQWSIQHIGAGTVTLNGNTNHTITGPNTFGASITARFATRRTASNTFVTYRLS